MDHEPPAVPRMRDGVLIFSKTNAFRHVEQIPHAVAVIGSLAEAQGRGVVATENAAIFRPDLLARFRIIVLASSTGDAYTPAQRAAFRAWIERGGRIVALHAAGDSSHVWPFYLQQLIGARFIGHPGGADHIQPAEVSLTQPQHPIVRGVQLPWRPLDEWYSFDRVPAPRNATVIATIDERSYRPDPRQVMGAVHPIAWISKVGRGQVFYTALGHTPESYDDANHRRIIANALRWAGRR